MKGILDVTENIKLKKRNSKIDVEILWIPPKPTKKLF